LTDRIALEATKFGAKLVPEKNRSPHYLSLHFDQGLPADLPGRLAAVTVYVNARGDRLRVTPHLYNDEADIQRFLEAVACTLKLT